MILDGWARYLDAPLARRRTPFVAIACIAIAVAFDLATRSGLASISGTLCALAACGALLASKRLRSPTSIVLVAVAPLFAVWLCLRASVWLVVPNVIAICGLVLLAASMSSDDSLWELSIPRVVGRALQAAAQAIFAPAYLFAGTKRTRWGGVVRGVLIAAPLLFVLGVLLRSADAVFASFLQFDLGGVITHVVPLTFGLLAMAGLFRLASIEHVEMPDVRGPRLASPEWTVLLGGINLMLGAFAVARLIALSEGGQRVIRSAGLTYAEYARTGFFQLLAASILTIAALAALRAVAERGSPRLEIRFKVMSFLVVVLALVLVVSAFQRLVLYEAAFNVTMLRIYVQAVIVFVGVVFALYGASIVGVGGTKMWVWSAAGIAALVLLFAMNVFNPEAFVARYNLAHQQTMELDATYVKDLGDDAASVFASRPSTRGLACLTRSAGMSGWAAYNASHDHARLLRSKYCVDHSLNQGGHE